MVMNQWITKNFSAITVTTQTLYKVFTTNGVFTDKVRSQIRLEDFVKMFRV